MSADAAGALNVAAGEACGAAAPRDVGASPTGASAPDVDDSLGGEASVMVDDESSSMAGIAVCDSAGVVRVPRSGKRRRAT